MPRPEWPNQVREVKPGMIITYVHSHMDYSKTVKVISVGEQRFKILCLKPTFIDNLYYTDFGILPYSPDNWNEHNYLRTPTIQEEKEFISKLFS